MQPPLIGGGAEVSADPLRVPLRPGSRRLRLGVLLVKRDEQPYQLAPHRRRSKDLWQLRQIYQPIPVPGGPVWIVTVDDAIDRVVRLARLMKQAGDARRCVVIHT